MSTPIRLKHSKVVGRVPTSGDLVDGELAVSLADEKIYMKNAGGDVVQVAGDGTYVKIAGDTMTGNLVINNPGNPSDLWLKNGLGTGTPNGAHLNFGNTEGDGCISYVDAGNRFMYFKVNNYEIMRLQDVTGSNDLRIGLGYSGMTPSSEFLTVGGSATFNGSVQSGNDPNNGVDTGCKLYGDQGTIAASADSGVDVWIGNLKGTTSPTSQITSTGSATFAGDVAIGDSATFLGNLGDAVALLPPTIAEQFANIISSLPVAQPFTGDPTTLPADIPTPLKDALVRVTTAGKINLNSDGSATFDGTVQSGGDPNDGSTAGAKMVSSGVVQATRASGSSTSAVWTGYLQGTTSPTSRINAGGSALFAGDTIVGETDGAALTNASGVYLGKEGYVTLFKSSTETSRFFACRNYGDTDPVFVVENDGSATFAGQVDSGSVAVNGGCRLTDDGTLIARPKDGRTGSASAIEVYSNGYTASDRTVFIQKDGSAEFKGDLDVTNGTGITRLNPLGQLYIQSSTGIAFDVRSTADITNTLFAVSSTDGSVVCDGSAEFAGAVACKPGDNSAAVLGTVGGTAAIVIDNSSGTRVVDIRASGNAVFTGSVTASNVTFNLEPDNEDNYTTTTEEYEETIQVPVENGVATADLVDGAPEQQFTEQTVTKTREIKTYTGPTMDVKEQLLAYEARFKQQDAVIAQMTAALKNLGADIDPPAAEKKSTKKK